MGLRSRREVFLRSERAPDLEMIWEMYSIVSEETKAGWRRTTTTTSQEITGTTT